MVDVEIVKAYNHSKMWKLIFLSFLLRSTLAAKETQRKDVSDMEVIVVDVASQWAQDQLLKSLEYEFNSGQEIDQVHILSVLKNGTIALLVPNEARKEALQLISKYNPSPQAISISRVPNIQITDGWTHSRRTKRSLDQFQLESYNTYSSIMEYLEELSAVYPQICQTEIIGLTFEGRELKVIKIQGGQTGESRVRVFIEGTQHAREWISPAAIVYMIHQLVTGYVKGDRWIVELLDRYEFHLLPIMNPDGYNYTYVSPRTRYWRKNKNITNNSTTCIGVDLNRNWGFQWSGRGGSRHICSELYRGKQEFSEAETRLTADYINRYNGSWHSYFSFHSYGQLILFPWSHSYTNSPDHHYHSSAAQEFAEGLRQRNNITYTSGSVTDILYVASGSSESWAYGSAHIPYAYTIELPSSSFVLPKERIAPTALELLDGFRYYFQHIESTRPELYDLLLDRSTGYTHSIESFTSTLDIPTATEATTHISETTTAGTTQVKPVSSTTMETVTTQTATRSASLDYSTNSSARVTHHTLISSSSSVTLRYEEKSAVQYSCGYEFKHGIILYILMFYIIIKAIMFL